VSVSAKLQGLSLISTATIVSISLFWEFNGFIVTVEFKKWLVPSMEIHEGPNFRSRSLSLLHMVRPFQP